MGSTRRRLPPDPPGGTAREQSARESAHKVVNKSARWQQGPISVSPIGVLRSPFVERADAPRQPLVAEDVVGTVELFAGRGYEDALQDLEAFDYIWLLVWLDRNADFRPKVQPPRSQVKRGVFATRAPYRPNPIGLSAVRLLGVEGLRVKVQGLDLLDGTPVLDIKPYLPYSDAIPQANHGWLDVEARVGERPGDPIAAYAVSFAERAEAQLSYLEREHGIALRGRIVESLSLGPKPHAYRRIRRVAEGYVLALKDFRVAFTCEGRNIEVRHLFSGYRPKELFAPEGKAPAVHRAFVARWGTPPA